MFCDFFFNESVKRKTSGCVVVEVDSSFKVLPVLMGVVSPPMYIGHESSLKDLKIFCTVPES